MSTADSFRYVNALYARRIYLKLKKDNYRGGRQCKTVIVYASGGESKEIPGSVTQVNLSSSLRNRYAYIHVSGDKARVSVGYINHADVDDADLCGFFKLKTLFSQ